MESSLNQANHNQKFHDCISREFEEQFYDWRITSLFYVAIHYLKALAIQRNCPMGNTHYDIEQTANPYRKSATLNLDKKIWNIYKKLYKYSQSSRYDGFTDFETFDKLKQKDYIHSLLIIDEFRSFIKNQGIIIDTK